MAAEQAIKSVKGVKGVQIIMTAESDAPQASSSPVTPSKPAPTNKIAIDAKRIIAVGSGKGGVGKSTVAMNLAVALAQSGQKVGLLDADIYGPSVPTLTGLAGQKPSQNEDGKIVPLRAHGIDVMSIGFMVEADKALIWRGPMAQSALIQMARDVAWVGLDTLVIDLPPGTGDVQLTLSQRINIDGAVIVSTPQDIALDDVKRGIEMFQKMNVPILGLIENMSYYCCPACGHKDNVFGHGGAKAHSESINIPFLGDIPLNSEIRQNADQGKPSVSYYEDIVGRLSL
jgi:ATP-binding protein involved in chromosome partitioning